jgi:CRISPR/Cas system endoribonuclease Cas6 (RAMP superfamily)
VLGGLTGEVEYADVPGDLAALLALGELTHVGKATVFGFGRYERRAA